MTPPYSIRKTDRQAPMWWVSVRTPHAYAMIFWLLSLVLFWRPFNDLARLSFHDELASHILLIPLITAFLIWFDRKRIFCTTLSSPAVGMPLVLTAVLLRYALPTSLWPLNAADRLSALAASIVLMWIGLFILCYGLASFKAAAFPMLYLALMVPIPTVVIGRLISFLQIRSADICYILFRLIGVPVIRHGFRFSLPGLNIEVAQQCSGIHSALSLFIAGLLAAHLVLPSPWKKIWFALGIFPLAIFKNAVRIVTLAWLSIYVNPAILQSRLHHQGGLPFAVVAIAPMGVLLWLLRGPLPLARTIRTAYSRIAFGMHGLSQHQKPN